MDKQVKEMLDKINQRLDLISKKQDLILTSIDKEAQLVRDRMDSSFTPRKDYTCDLYVDDFQNAVKLQETRYSSPWHIDQYQSTVFGRVRFMNAGKEMEAGLDHARHPRELGLTPRSSGNLHVQATIVDTSGQLCDLVVGEKDVYFNEATVRDNNMWGYGIGVVSTRDLIEKGYWKESNVNKALLVRYTIKALGE